MNIVTRAESGATVLSLDNRFDAYEVDGFRSVVEQAVHPAAVVRLDLSGVRFIDSTALAELVRTRTALLRVGGRLLLDPLSDAVRVILEITGLDCVFLEDTSRLA